MQRLRYSPSSRPSVRTLVPTSVARAKQVDGALVEAEVVGRAHHGAVFDHIDAVAGQPGEQARGRIDLPDVPQAGQEQAPLGAGHHLVDRPPGHRPIRHPAPFLESARRHQVVDVRRHLDARAGRTGPVVAEVRRVARPRSSRPARAAGRCRRRTTPNPTSRRRRRGGTRARARTGRCTSVKGTFVSCSRPEWPAPSTAGARIPPRRRPPAAENTVRPSSASCPPMRRRTSDPIMSATPEGGRITS
jgi:hypothetical protein